MKRSAPMKRSGPPQRKTEMKKENPKRRKKAYRRSFGEKGAMDRGDAVRAMACLAGHPGVCWGKIEAAHVIARGAGSAFGDLRHLVPLCVVCHKQADGARAEFEARTGLNLLEEAARIDRMLTDLGFPGLPTGELRSESLRRLRSE